MAIKDFFKTGSGSWSSFWRGFSWMNPVNATTDGQYVATYFTGVKILSDNMAKMTPQVYDENNKPLHEHNVSKVLRNPNNVFNRARYAKLIEQKRLNDGDSLVYIQRDNNGVPEKLWVLDRNSIKNAILKENGSLYYTIDFSQTNFVPFNDEREVSAEDILHDSFHIDQGSVFGKSAQTILCDQTNILSRGDKMIDKFYQNNATSAMALKTTVDKAAVMGKLKESNNNFTEKYTGELNSGKVIELPPNTELVPVHQKFVDAQLIDTKRHVIEVIASLFGIPKAMFQATDNNESIEQQTRLFLALSLSPIIEMRVAEMETKLLTAEELEKGYKIEYNTEKLIETDIKTKAEIVTMQVTKGVMTPNEAAKKMGNDPIDSEFGDLHWTQTQNQPLEYYDQWGNNMVGNNGNQVTDNGNQTKTNIEDES